MSFPFVEILRNEEEQRTEEAKMSKGAFTQTQGFDWKVHVFENCPQKSQRPKKKLETV